MTARSAVEQLRLTPILFELGARPHPPRALYRSYLAQSDVFVGIYWERYGWIVVSSYNTESDGPFAPNIRAMRAMWEDTHRRFALAPGRAYMAGFSGTARAACRLAQAAEGGSFAGVIGCAGGFADDLPPTRDLPFAYFSTAGTIRARGAAASIAFALLMTWLKPEALYAINASVTRTATAWPPCNG